MDSLACLMMLLGVCYSADAKYSNLLQVHKRATVDTERVDADIVGQKAISCPAGYSLLSCGIQNTQQINMEVYRYAVPENNTACLCYDYFGAQCRVWCAEKVVGFEIVTTSRHTHGFDVRCPAGKKVLGCHIRSTFNMDEDWREHYPTTDGQTCHCYDQYGAKCIASCASNVIKHEIVSAHGTGVVKAMCPSETHVLGCGVNPDDGRGPEPFRTYYVSSERSCKCFDNFGVTCYAICGRLV